ncbi:MAG: hypothetical protein LBC86_08055 [Oscillospiraceae bacterium]|jgi:hypothetical protein|nr:hypothetical protein [Oscillospiraceae bacterium]
MSVMVQKTVSLLDMLPESDQTLAYEIIKKLVLAWDPDFTRLTPDERARLEIADIEIKNNEIVSHNDIDWS